ncbi:MAG: FGGY family carbohydrate kinase [Azospirillaceae bacterium]
MADSAADAPLVVGIDLGTGSVRALVFDPTGACLATAGRPTPMVTVGPGAAEFEPEALWRATAGAIAEAVGQIDRPGRIRAVAAASFAESGICLDGAGRAIGVSQAWYDKRPAAQNAMLRARFGEPALALKSGMRLEPVPGVSKLLWLRDERRDVFDLTTRWLNVADFVAYRLSGEIATDFSLAGRMMALDLAAGTYNRDLLDALGLPVDLLPPLADNGDLLGPVTAEAAAATGLPGDCMVVVGGHDHVLGALASGALKPAAGLDSMGTAEALLRPIDRPITDERVVTWGFEQGRLSIAGLAIPFVMGGLVTSSAAIEWFRQTVAAGADYDTLIAGAREAAPGCGGTVFVPHLRFGSPPDVGADAAGAFLGLSTDTDPSTLFRAVLEGLACDLRKIDEHITALAETAGGRTPDRLMVTGGAARNDLLLAIKAAVYARPLEVIEMPESTSQGAALLACLGARLHDGLDAAIEAFRPPSRTVAPDPALVETYDRLYRTRYRPAVDALRAWRAAG